MIDLLTLRTRLLETGYTVEFSRDRDIDLQEPSVLPIVYIGYNSIESQRENSTLAMDIYSLNGENLAQSFTIQLVCLPENFPTVWKTLYKKLIGWNPVSSEAPHTSFSYLQGGVMGLSNGKLYWADVWRVGFPTNSIL